MIGLSPLPTAHRKLFQQLRVRTSTRCYSSFILAMGRSLRFRVYAQELYRAHFGLAFAAAPRQKRLTSLLSSNSPDHNAKGTQSGTQSPLLPLVGTRFQDLFHSPSGVLFTFPSRYWFTIGHGRVCSLGGWSPQIPAGFLVSRGTQVLEPHANVVFRLQDSHLVSWGVPTHFDYTPSPSRVNPALALQPRTACRPV